MEDGHPLKPQSVLDVERRTGSTLSEIAEELEKEEAELARVRSLGFSGEPFEQYERELEERIEELAITAEYVARITKRRHHVPTERGDPDQGDPS